MSAAEGHTPPPWTYFRVPRLVTSVAEGDVATILGLDETRAEANAALITDAPETRRQRDLLLKAAQFVLPFIDGALPESAGALKTAIAECEGEKA